MPLTSAGRDTLASLALALASPVVLSRPHRRSRRTRRRPRLHRPLLPVRRLTASGTPAPGPRARRRRGARHRAHRPAALVRRASHPDRLPRRHQHGRPDRRRVRQPVSPRTRSQALMKEADWDLMFLADSPFRYKTFRRKEDARAFPGQLDFGLKGGFKLPSGLNAGQQIELLLDSIALPYYGVQTSTTCRRRSAVSPPTSVPASRSSWVPVRSPSRCAPRCRFPRSSPRSCSTIACWWTAAPSTTCPPTS